MKGPTNLGNFRFALRTSLCCVLLAVLSTASSPADVTAIAHAVDSHYNHLRTLEADFVEIYTGAGSERTESGTLWLKKPGKMRWDYRSPREKLFLSDGKQAWFYIPGEQQARKISARQLDDLRSPLAFLLGRSRLDKELKGLSLATDVSPLEAGDTVLRGVPIGMEDQASQIVLEITASDQISRILLDWIDGSVTEYRFSNQKENIQVSDRQFRFVPPPGVEVIEGDFAQ
ncbi:MAG: outer membrane lipoprotein chaperone LolA [Terriglobales bacterium]